MGDPKIFVALDGKNLLEVKMFCRMIEENFGYKDVGIKLNLDFVLWWGTNVLEEFSKYKLFADLKMWNGIRTMKAVLTKLMQNHVGYTNIYAQAGTEYLKECVEHAGKKGLKILGLTVLSHYDDNYCWHLYDRVELDVVQRLCRDIEKSGCYGAILPATFLIPQVEASGFDRIKKVCPGIRPGWYKNERHKQSTTPLKAITDGADMLVIGSPITKVKEPILAIETILEEIKQGDK